MNPAGNETVLGPANVQGLVWLDANRVAASLAGTGGMSVISKGRVGATTAGAFPLGVSADGPYKPEHYRY